MSLIQDYSALPPAAANSGKIYFVLAGYGVAYTGSYKPGGVYFSDGVVWSYMGLPPITGAAASLAAVVTDETPAGVVNGSNATFTTAFDFLPESVELFINGLLQIKPTHYNTVGANTLLLSDAPHTGETLRVNYIKNATEETSPTGLTADQFVDGEVPTGLINGSNATFTTNFAFVPETVEVMVNGLDLERVLHFNTSGVATIILSDAPHTGDTIFVNYIKA